MAKNKDAAINNHCARKAIGSGNIMCSCKRRYGNQCCTSNPFSITARSSKGFLRPLLVDHNSCQMDLQPTTHVSLCGNCDVRLVLSCYWATVCAGPYGAMQPYGRKMYSSDICMRNTRCKLSVRIEPSVRLSDKPRRHPRPHVDRLICV
jgi:hypothetical protein